MKYSNLPLITLIIISQSILQAQNLVEQITNIGGNKDGVKQYELNIEKIDNSLFFPSYYSTNSTYPSKPSLTKYDLITKQSSLVFRNNEVVREPYPLFKLPNGNILFWSKPGDFGSIRNLFNLDSIDKKITLVSDKLINGPQCSQIIDNNLYFSCSTGLPDEFWVSNGTILGTYTLKDIEGNPIKFPCGFTKYRDSLILFTAKTKYGQELYITDGINSEKTKLIKDINPSTTANGASGLVNYKDRVYFTGDNQVNGNEIWLTDGTTNNTQMLKDINPGPGSSIPSIIPTKETLLILAENPTIGKQFWSSDGTMAGTSALTNFTGQSSNFLTYWIEELDSILVLAIKIDMGYELYKYSKRLRSLELIKDINPGIASGVGYDYLKHKGII
jgi:ELWxxDGT repeat protein